MPKPELSAYAVDETPKPIAKPVRFSPLEAYALDPMKPQTAFGREEVASASLESAAESSQAVLENLGMIGATMLVPQAAIPAAMAKYGAAAKLVYQAGVRTGAAGLGRAAGTAAGQELKKAMAPQIAPTTPEEAWSQQWASAKEGALQQAVYGEAVLPGAAKLAAGTLQKIPEKGFFSEWDVVTKMRKKASLEAERAQEMMRLTEGAAKQAAMEQARNEAERIAMEIGEPLGKETARSQAAQLKTAIETGVNKAEKARYLALDKATAISLRPDGPGKVDTQPIVDRFVQLAKEIPVGSGFWADWTKLPRDVASPMNAALRQDAKIAKAATNVAKVAAANVMREAAAEAPALKTGAGGTLEDLVTSLNDLMRLKDAHGKAPVSVLLRARAAMSRAKADPETSDNLKSILDEMIPKYKDKKVGPVDQAINEGLAQINPNLIGEYSEARHFWHQSETMKRMVLYKIFQRTGDAKPLADAIGPRDPQAVTRVRVLLQDIGQEAQWPAIQRETFTNLILGRKGEVDLSGLSRRMDDWGSSTISQLTRAADGSRDAAMVARVDSLKNLSDHYRKLVQTEEPVVTSQRLQQIDGMLEALAGGSTWRDFLKTTGTYLVSPHVLSGAALGTVFGWKAALYGGATSAGLKQGADMVVRLAYDPVRLNNFVRHMDAFVKNGEATNLVNMARLVEAGMKGIPAAQAGAGELGRLLRSSHSPETQ